MSVSVSLRDLPVKGKKISQQLTVSPDTPKPTFFQGGPSLRYQKQVSVEAFDIEERTDGNHVIYLPFSYAYHHFPQLSPPSHRPISLAFQGSLLPRQKEIRDETFEILNRTRSILLCLHTGFGKTIYSLYLTSKIGLKTVILCHRQIIIDQWKQAIEKYLPEANVLIWTNKLKEKDIASTDILIANVINVRKWTRSMYASFGLVIADEVHTMCTEQFSKSLLWFTPQYVIGLSATPFRSDGMDRLIELYIGPEVVYRKLERVFNVYRLRTGFIPTVERLPDGTINWNSVLESQSGSLERNYLIRDLIRLFSNRTILVLVKRIEHARILYHLLTECKEDAGMFLGTDKIVDYDCRVLIATYSKGGVGFDHPRLDMLITAADVEEGFAQYLGRIFRRDDVSPIYLDLIDDNSTIVKHSRTRKQVYEEIGGVTRDFFRWFPDFDLYRTRLNTIK